MKPCKAPCSGCAFTPGAAANLEPHNQLKGQICLLGGEPFYCHDGKDWQSPQYHGRISRAQFKEFDPQICQGWASRVRLLAKAGYYKEKPLWRKAWAQIARKALEEFCATKNRKEKRQAMRTLK